MGNMKLLNKSLKRFTAYAGIVLTCSIPIYYFAISKLWQYELGEHNITLTSEASREDSFLIIGAITLLTVFFFALLLGGFIWLNRRISNKLWQPFYKSLEQIKNFDLNKHDKVTFEKPDIAEFKELNTSLDKLITGSITAYNQQKEFADNASHELQTPLAIIQSKLELLQQSNSLTNEQYQTIEETLHALTRVNRINKNLLLLTRIENSQFMDKETVNLSLLLNNTITLFTNFSENKEISLHKNISPDVFIEGNKTLIEIVLNNLLTNAIRHSLHGSLVSVTLLPNKLTVANAGNISLHSDQLFKRFATASSQTPGTGLGLAIVKQISDRYQWVIRYDFKNNQHIFSIQL
jgi:two-component system, OmpR family, sensor kinase